MPRVLITGVRGKTGVPLAELLAAGPGIDVFGGSSDPSSVAFDRVTPTSFSWDDPSGWAAAIDGVDSVYLVRPDRADAPELVAALLAETPRDARIVLLSERDADSFAPDSWALRVERTVRESGHADGAAPELVHAGLYRPAFLLRRDRRTRAAAVRGRRGDRGVDRRP